MRVFCINAKERGLRYRCWLSVAVTIVISFLLMCGAPAQSQPLLPTRGEAPPNASPKPLTRTALPATDRGERAGTGFYVDDIGHMLTARHVVQDCSRIMVQKEGRTSSARIVAVSTPYDIALLHTAKTRGLAAVFPRSIVTSTNDIVFAADYASLPTMLARGGVLANASVSPATGSGESGHIALQSTLTFGSSGAPVLDSRGLIEGVVSRRTAINRVLAVGSTAAKAFLAASDIRFQQDDRPQISGSASRAHRAASISARVICVN
ncbi:trypsin-like peptidase domain-containing protein [Rhodopseudomonas sp. RCAM05734]|uniref:trypsin-like peptidase domain-containing protein n=1 Tax=Rhodopseudomonas sp. RCAM05734 TaxID=3457549 RepID=UPI004043DA34